jgi:hypothetical protein
MGLFRIQITLPQPDPIVIERLRTVLDHCKSVGDPMPSDSPFPPTQVFYTEVHDTEANIERFYSDLIHTAVDETAIVETTLVDVPVEQVQTQ